MITDLNAVADASVVLPTAGSADTQTAAASGNPSPQGAGGAAAPANSGSSAAAARPASYHELKAALPGADAAFLTSQLEANATVGQAQAAFMTHLVTRNQTLAKQLDEQIVATAAAPLKKPGAQAVPAAEAPGSQAGGGDALAAFNDAVLAEVDRSRCAKHVAHATVCRTRPDLRDAMLAAHNAQFNGAAKRR